MTKITNIDRSNINSLRVKLQAKLEEFACENGMSVGSFNISFMPDSFTCKNIMFGLQNAGEPQVDPKFKQDLIRRGYSVGLTLEMLGKTVIMPARGGMSKFEFLGMKNSKAIFMAVEGENKGKRLLFDALSAAHYLKKT